MMIYMRFIPPQASGHLFSEILTGKDACMHRLLPTEICTVCTITWKWQLMLGVNSLGPSSCINLFKFMDLFLHADIPHFPHLWNYFFMLIFLKFP